MNKKDFLKRLENNSNQTKGKEQENLSLSKHMNQLKCSLSSSQDSPALAQTQKQKSSRNVGISSHLKKMQEQTGDGPQGSCQQSKQCNSAVRYETVPRKSSSLPWAMGMGSGNGQWEWAMLFTANSKKHRKLTAN